MTHTPQSEKIRKHMGSACYTSHRYTPDWVTSKPKRIGGKTEITRAKKVPQRLYGITDVSNKKILLASILFLLIGLVAYDQFSENESTPKQSYSQVFDR